MKPSTLYLVIFDAGYVAHRHHTGSPESQKNLLKGKYVFGESAACPERGSMKLAPGDARLCRKCFKGDRRTAGEWRAAQATAKAKATADALFGVFGMKEAK